jgi:anaerobic dimethyl sulfoxide reductase subunit B
MPKQLGFYYNSARCIACKTCQIACKDKNNLPVGVLWRRVVQYGGGRWIERNGFLIPDGMFVYSLSMGCNHCGSPACTSVCPTRAIHKNADGIVLIDPERCIGCRYCQWACPYGTPQFDQTQGVMTKCNFCYDLLAQGQSPACVDACPMRAIEFGELGELCAKYGTVNAIEPLPDSNLTFPSIVINPHPHAQLSGQGTGKICNFAGEL